MPSAVVVCSLSHNADIQKSEISTSTGHQHSLPAPLSKVLVWVSVLEIDLADLVPRELRGACRLADYPRELTIKSICFWCRQNNESGRVYSDRYAKNVFKIWLTKKIKLKKKTALNSFKMNKATLILNTQGGTALLAVIQVQVNLVHQKFLPLVHLMIWKKLIRFRSKADSDESRFNWIVSD
jgi:hypothetical protein